MTAFAIAQLLELGCADRLTDFEASLLHASQTARNLQTLGVFLTIPVKGKPQLLEGLVEGGPMAIHFRIREGAVHIPEHDVQHRHPASSGQTGHHADATFSV